MGISERLKALDDRAIKASGVAGPPPSPEVVEQRRAAAEAKLPIGTGYARFVVRYESVLATVLVVAAILLAVTGNGDTAILCVILAVIAGLWGLLFRRYTRR
jgi:hypothetical protein